MADDRPVGDVVDELAALRKMVEDMRSTFAAQVSRCPTGVIVGSLLGSLPDTLPLDGRTVSRVTYAVLWKWVSDHGFVAAGVFGNGDASTTFVLPDFRGRVVRGTAAGETVGQLTGADSITLTTAQLPSHTHGFTTGSSGSHGGHVAQQLNAATGSVFTYTADNTNNNNGSHTHSGTTDGGSGSGSLVDVRQAGVALNYLIYT